MKLLIGVPCHYTASEFYINRLIKCVESVNVNGLEIHALILVNGGELSSYPKSDKCTFITRTDVNGTLNARMELLKVYVNNFSDFNYIMFRDVDDEFKLSESDLSELNTWSEDAILTNYVIYDVDQGVRTELKYKEVIARNPDEIVSKLFFRSPSSYWSAISLNKSLSSKLVGIYENSSTLFDGIAYGEDIILNILVLFSASSIKLTPYVIGTYYRYNENSTQKTNNFLSKLKLTIKCIFIGESVVRSFTTIDDSIVDMYFNLLMTKQIRSLSHIDSERLIRLLGDKYNNYLISIDVK